MKIIYVLYEIDDVYTRANRMGEVDSKKDAKEWINIGNALGKIRCYHEVYKENYNPIKFDTTPVLPSSNTLTVGINKKLIRERFLKVFYEWEYLKHCSVSLEFHRHQDELVEDLIKSLEEK